MKLKKEHVILVAATIVPFGFVALGLWKAYELCKQREKEDKDEVKKTK